MSLKRVVPRAPYLPETQVFACVACEATLTRTLRA
jgi:hypothetical protein